jgi:hypothetical protein
MGGSPACGSPITDKLSQVVYGAKYPRRCRMCAPVRALTPAALTIVAAKHSVNAAAESVWKGCPVEMGR